MYVTQSGSGPTVLFVHGQPGLGADFDAVAAFLVDDHRVIAPDRPGYGRSGDQALPMVENARLLAQLLEERSTAPAVVVGHSYGGGVAVLLAAARPDLVSGLVLVGSVGRADSVNAFDQVLAAPLLGEAVSAVGLVALGHVLPRLRRIATLSEMGVFERLRTTLPDSGYAEVAAGRGRQIWRSFVFEQRSLIREISDVEASLRAIVAPTVVISGEWDVVVPPSVAKSIAALVPGAELLILDRMGHFVPRDAPEVVASAVRRTEALSSVGRSGELSVEEGAVKTELAARRSKTSELGEEAGDGHCADEVDLEEDQANRRAGA
jgi:pimeloyl-ACP methyl ester carboxylesterase